MNRQITHVNPFFYKNNTLSREIHSYNGSDWVERYKGHSIWKHETNCRNDGSRTFDIVVDGVIVETCGYGVNLTGVRKVIDLLITKNSK
jgi:hypothetical protein